MNPGRVRRVLVPLAIVASLVTGLPALGVPNPSTRAAPHDSGALPLVSGTSSYEHGAFVWTDYGYDDRGADTDTLAGGDTTYPEGMAPNNVADLVQLRLAPHRGGLAVAALLETLTDRTRPLIGLALDLDGPSHGAASLPGSWTAAAPLGMDRLYLLGRGGGRVLGADAQGRWQATGRFQVAMDEARNTVSAVLPVKLPAEGAMHAVAAVGYEDGGTSWVAGSAPVMDLAFVTDPWPSRPYVLGVALDASGFATGDSAYWQVHPRGKGRPGTCGWIATV